MTLEYILFDPTGNRTVLVETPVPPAAQPDCAAALLAAEPTAEQVGFVSPGGGDADIALRMAGGEFCGNAAMSAAALRCMTTGRCGTVRVRVSGAAEPVTAEITPGPGGSFSGAVAMPRPRGPEQITLSHGGQCFRLPLLRFDGIAHLIVTTPMERGFAESAVRDWCAALDVDGLGLMLLDEAVGALTPLVYVPAGDTLYWERSCASGTAAAGVYYAETEKRPVSLRFAEPGGSLTVSAGPDGVTLRGTVLPLRRSTLTVDI